MTETFKPAIWFPFQKWGGSLIWFTPTVQDSRSSSPRQPTGDINREKCLSRKVFTRTERLCPLNTPFLSRRYFSKSIILFIFWDHFQFFLLHCPTHPIFLSSSHFFSLTSQTFLPEFRLPFTWQPTGKCSDLRRPSSVSLFRQPTMALRFASFSSPWLHFFPCATQVTIHSPLRTT